MGQIRLGRISAVVAAVCLAGGAANGDAVALMVASAMEPDMSVDVTKGQLRVDLEDNGLLTVLALEDRLRLPRLKGAQYQPLACTYDARLARRACRSSDGGDSVSSAVSFALRDTAGRVQDDFYAAVTDSVLIQEAYTSRGTDKAGHPVSATGRGTHLFSDVSAGKRARMLNGADTSFRTKRFGTRFESKEAKVIVYSGVTVANTGGARRYPSSGVVFVTRHLTYGDRTKPKQMFRNLIVHFDGTRNPEAYISGKHYRLDLLTQVATPLTDD